MKNLKGLNDKQKRYCTVSKKWYDSKSHFSVIGWTDYNGHQYPIIKFQRKYLDKGYNVHSMEVVTVLYDDGLPMPQFDFWENFNILASKKGWIIRK